MSALNVIERSLPERIRWARKRAGLSQEQLAARVGSSRRHVIRWENKTSPTTPGPRYAALIAEATGQPAELFADDDEEPDLASEQHVAALLIEAVRELVQLERV